MRDPNTRLSSTIYSAITVVLVGVAIYEAVALLNRRTEIRALRERNEAVADQLAATRYEHERVLRALESAQTRLAATTSAPSAPGVEALAATMSTWLGRIEQVRAILAQRPKLGIPELALLEDKDWFNLLDDARLDSDENIRITLATLRTTAEQIMARQISRALGDYVAAHDGQLPSITADLAAVMDHRIAPEWLNRYQVLHTGKFTDLSDRDQMEIVQATPVDPDFDRVVRIGVNSYGSGGSAVGLVLQDAQSAFAREHDGQRATRATELTPYLKWPVSEAKLQAVMDRPRPKAR
jgi:hypothetical protein